MIWYDGIEYLDISELKFVIKSRIKDIGKQSCSFTQPFFFWSPKDLIKIQSLPTLHQDSLFFY